MHFHTARLGERYRHFFIDEFQDTSEMQWQNLIPLIDNALSGEIDGEKGTLMIVGDPKQSIYRWRGGKAEQFIDLSKGKNPFVNPDKKLFTLGTNYRSYSEIIGFNNDFFKFLSNEFIHLDYKDLYQNHSFQKCNNKTGGYVNISFVPKQESKKDDEETIEKSEHFLIATLATIQKVISQGFEYQEIVVLTRKRKQGIAVANYLTEQGIPLLSSETLLIQNATEVKFIINLLKYLRNPSDAESKALFLHYFSENNQDQLPVHEFIKTGMEIKQELAFEKWLSQFGITLNFQNIRKKSLYEAVEIIVSKFINLKTNNAYVHYFLDLVLERDVRNQSGISDFLNHWDKNFEKFSIPSPEGKNAVRIMTIHKAKGLEFPVVIMPFAEEDYTKKPKDKIWLDAENEDLGLPKVLIDNTKSVEGFGANAAMVFGQKKQEELLDNINVLYVALTRAEEQLYIISQVVEQNDKGIYPNNMAAFFIKYLENESVFEANKLEYEFGNPAKKSMKVEAENAIKTLPASGEIINPNRIKIAQREALMWGTHQQEAIEFGNTIHEILSFISTKNDIDLALTKALESGTITIKQSQIVYKTIQEIVNHDELTHYFSPENKVLNEQTIIQKVGNTSKPDRMVFNSNNEVFLLDYKTGIHQSKHQLQLENYQNAIEKMGFKVTKKALVYIGENIEIVNL